MNLGLFMAKLAKNVVAVQLEHGTLLATIRKSVKAKTLSPATEMYFCDLLERQAEKQGRKIFLNYLHKRYSYADMNLNANRVAHGLIGLSAKPRDGVAIMTANSPAYYDVFFAAQKLGMFAVPTNTALRGDGLAYLLTNSGVRFLFIHPSLLPYFESIRDKVKSVERVIVDETEDPAGEMADGYARASSLYDDTLPLTRPVPRPTTGDLAVLMYTSGTTGLPKGVVYRHGDSMLSMIEALGRTMVAPDDVMYTCLPLYHANALFVTSLTAIGAGASVALDKKFSASQFWDRCRFYNATTFNLLGAMIPILMKQPERPDDRDHQIRRVVTSACPAELWEKFEQRFGVEIWEGYGAVDGGGVLIMNIGNAPKGSIGKPLGAKIRVVDSEGNDVKPGERGELLLQARKGKSKSDGSVEYYGNDQATDKKVRDGWIRTGDYVYADKKGYLYFVGRDSESMRRRGENVSTYEVEVEIMKHPAVQEAAVYGVPAELGEDDIMASLVLVPDKEVAPAELIQFLSDKLAYFAVPRYWRIMPELPKTGTHRVIKGELQKLGVTPDTFDAEKAGVMPKRRA
ncbi:MAG TPA: AMP-binding protein [bacterium]|nr:AMP-binding protein [bacterium]